MQATDGDLGRMYRDIGLAAEGLRRAKSVLVISHIDADGITAGSIATRTAERLGIEHRTVFLPKIDADAIDMINSAPEDYVWVCDLGSGYLSEFTSDLSLRWIVAYALMVGKLSENCHGLKLQL